MRIAITIANVMLVGLFLIGFVRSLHGFRPGTKDAANREYITKFAHGDPRFGLKKKTSIEAGAQLPLRVPKWRAKTSR